MVVLRKIQKSDLQFLLEIRNDASTRVNLENDSIFNLNDCENWFETTHPEWYIIESGDLPVGYFRTNGDEVGADIHPTHRRMGYAREAYKIYLKNKKYASLWVFDDNFAKKLYLELGFLENGNFKIIRDRKYLQMVYENII